MSEPAADTSARPDRRRARVAGAASVAAVSTLVAAIAHATAGGGWPNAATLLIALLASVFLTLPLVGARLRSWRLGLAVAVDQLVFHALFASIGSATAVPGSATHAHHDALPALLLGAESATTGLGMGAHHAIAAGLSFALLRGGWALVLAAVAAGAELLLRGLRRLPSPSSLSARRLVAVPAEPRPAHALDVLRHGLQRRGPPVAPALG